MKIDGRLLRREWANRSRYGRELLTLVLLVVFFLVGSIGGSIVGTGQLSAGETLFLEDGNIYGSDNFIGLLVSCSKYHLVALLFSTSLLGVLFIPLTMAFRGFVLSCTVASLAAAYPDHSFLIIAVVLGVPAVFTVPGLFIISFEGMLFSERLLSLYGRRTPRPAYGRRGNRILVAFILVVAAAAAQLLVVPTIVRLLI